MGTAMFVLVASHHHHRQHIIVFIDMIVFITRSRRYGYCPRHPRPSILFIFVAKRDPHLSLEEEKHLLLAKAHLVLAAKCRLKSLEEARWEAVSVNNEQAKKEIEWASSEVSVRQQVAKQELRNQLETTSGKVLLDKQTLLIVLGADRAVLSRCRPDMHGDPDLILAACQDNVRALDMAMPELRADRNLIMQAVSLDGRAVEFASPELQGDRELVLAAVKSYPCALHSASDELLADPDFVRAAVRCQTRRYVSWSDSHILRGLFEGGVSDKELLLEAAKVDGRVVQSASPELKEDEDFVLEMMRTTPKEDRSTCYMLAEQPAEHDVYAHFEGACDSLLAGAGEVAPILTVRMLANDAQVPEAPGIGQREQPLPTTCEVSLLSGASFRCRLPRTETESTSSSEAGPSQGSKRRRAGLSPTVSELAECLVAELHTTMQVDPPPTRVFIVFTKREADGQDVSTTVTPWDWSRPLSEFC